MSKSNKKVVVVTGCSKGGIGYALCKEFAKQGCRVFATARRLEAMEGLEELGIQRVTLDVTSVKSISSAAESIASATGSRIDILVNNAGISLSMPILDMSLDTFRGMLETNTISIMAMTQAFAPYMIARRSGKIVNVSSIMAMAGAPYRGAYTASKCAVNGLSDVLRMELKPFGVEVVVLMPGVVETNILNNYKGRNNVPEGSFYKPIADTITKGLTAPEVRTPVEKFAAYNVRKILGRRTPYYIFSAAKANLVWFVGTFLPRSLSDYFYSRYIGLNKLKLIKAQ